MNIFLCKPIWSSQWQTQISFLNHLINFHFFSGNWLHSPWFYITRFAVRIRVLITSHDSWNIFTIGPFLLIDASTFNNPVQFHLKMNPSLQNEPNALNLKEFSEMSFLEISFCVSYTRSYQINVTGELCQTIVWKMKETVIKQWMIVDVYVGKKFLKYCSGHHLLKWLKWYYKPLWKLYKSILVIGFLSFQSDNCNSYDIRE